MKELDKKSALFWMVFSFAVVLLSFDLGVGSLSYPGPGFLPALAGTAMFILSLALFSTSALEKQKKKTLVFSGGMLRVAWVLSALVLYGVLLEKLGFLLAAFLLMGFLLLGFGKQKIRFVILFAALSSFGAFALFHLWLKSPMPKGLFGL